MSEARRLKRKARRNLHRARVRVRKRLENRNPDTRAPVPAHPEPPVRPHYDPKGSGRYHQTSLSTKEQERQTAQNRHQEVPEGSLGYNEPHRREARCVRETSQAPYSETRREGRPEGAAVGKEAAALARQVSSKGASRFLCCNGLHSQKESDLIFRRQEKIELTDEQTQGLEEEEATPSQLPPSTHPDTGSRVISSPCDQLSDIDAGIKQAEDLVDEVVKTTLNHINSLLRARTIFRIKKEIIVDMKMDVEFFKDDGPLPPGPLRKKYRAGYVRRFRRNSPPEEELLSDKTARQLASLLNGQSVVQPSSDRGVDLSPRLYPFVAESFLSSPPELISPPWTTRPHLIKHIYVYI
ncbi:hypothetical protein QAD02_016076 [Eretmocerus hayati]|uniref:Uncharacterized protein n=1 Tax=Eretmocerus hayati TaxID=131215 RepID=A0ACC2P9J9_9HYME|nr:hypothetical protein QAD02_016076 [Eretmocerus hayati]